MGFSDDGDSGSVGRVLQISIDTKTNQAKEDVGHFAPRVAPQKANRKFPLS